ncbi:MAG: DsbE family thiol:disulfide interchange protein [Gammaproteobacteria bacterium]|jgi:cytochrome c biogenesis protein CcmG/thiol:disulfide interchange protein DsbE|nr:DsbE family thiol:disulfide interchange protein [Gammaproteobacteria bacterium]
MTRFLLPVVMLAVLVGFLAIGLQKDPGYVPSPLIGKPAPEFTLPRLDDPARTVSRSDLLGDVSLLNVWATWCVGCRQEHPFLVELARQAEVRIFGLNWKDDPDLARQWLRELGDPYTATAVDQDGRVAIDWGVYGAPETFLLDRAGVVLYKHIAPLTPAVWEAEFLPRIRKARGTQQ